MKFRLLRILTLLCLGTFAPVSFAGPTEDVNYYRVEQRNGVWWFRSPDGRPFYSLGVNVVDMGPSRERYNSNSPEYAAFLHYRSPEAWSATILQRLRSWNFNTLGGWSSKEAPRDAMPYTIVLHLGGAARLPWTDIFGADVERKFDESARRQITSVANDKNLIGYFSDNELGWWDDTLLDYYLKQPSTNATRKVLMRLLREHYRNDFSQLLKDFDVKGSTNFDELDHHSALTIKTGGRAMAIVDKFTFLVAERYYKLAHDAIRRYDANHLILGDRYHGYVPRSVAQAATPYVDVISTNYAADWTDGNIADFYLNSLFRVTRKPILITEFYFSAKENRSGNRNSSAAFPVVATQRERARSFRQNLASLTSLPFVVGAHWFQYYDEPSNGRTDGEDYNMGLVDIHDRPYEELTAAASAFSASTIHEKARLPQTATSVVQQVPRATTTVDQGLLYWDKARSFTPRTSSDPDDWSFADAYVCWTPEYLYLGVYTADFVERFLYGGAIPETERATLTVGIEGAKQLLSVRFGGKERATFAGPAVWSREWHSPTRNTILLKLPASMFGKTRLRPGDSINLNATLFSHSRAERMEWQKVIRLAK